ncbi:MAG: urea ABC transporter permease subunit UrtB [Gammaproteobacteria bacterium]|nr:MAG: urea ABC transporter permease subunit UrtB [Gammaproteobacteria bacterium]
MGSSFEELIPQLTTSSYQQKESLIEQLAGFDDDRVLPVFKVMLEGKLNYLKEDNRVVFIEEKQAGYEVTDVTTGKLVGVVDKSDIKKINVNNKLRGMLRSEIAKLSLKNKNADIRLAAVQQIISGLDNESAALLREREAAETDKDVLIAIQTGLAIMDTDSDDKEQKLNAVAILKESLLPEALQALDKLVKKDETGEYLEPDAEVRKLAQAAIATIESKRNINAFAETVFFGLSLGSVLLLAAIGLAITFGVMGVINMAHGELMMIGAYTTYMIQSLFPESIEYSLLLAVPAAFIVSGLFGIAIERGIIRFLYGRPLETLLATFGVSLILQQLVRTTISAQNVIVSTPAWMSGSLQINPVLSITYNRLYIIIFSLIVFALLLYVLKKTVLGLQVRAVSQNRSMARAMGVRSDWVDALTFGLGSGIAGIAGVALSQLTNVGPNLGQSYIIDSFMVVVFGGVGNLWGTLVGAMSLGVVNKFLEPWSGAVLAKILVLVFIILFIQKKPRGLFPQKGRGVGS